jgi:subtilisin family serine protease
MIKRSSFYLLLATFILGLTIFISPANAEGIPENIIPGHYIVVFNDNVRMPGDAANDIARTHALGLGHIYRTAIRGFSAQIPAQRLALIRADSRVAYIEPDLTVHAIKGKPPGKGGGGDTTTTAPPQVVPTGVDRINADLSTTANIDGTDDRVDVDIAIIDSGISTRHPDLNVYAGVNFTSSGKSNGEDDNGHGSHVAGTTAALDNNIGVVGVAPGARLWAVKVLDRRGSGSLSGVIAGIDWVTERALDIEVANMSLGFAGYSTAFNTAISNSVAAGITHVVAAGNSAIDANGYSPANHPDVITVSAVTDTDGIPGWLGNQSSYGGRDRNLDGLDDGDDDTFAWFSNFGTAVDIAAPGVDILSTWKGDKFNTISGTSMAAPHVTGVVALYLSLYPDTTPADVKAAIIGGGTSQGAFDGFIGDPDYSHEPLLNGAI